uniref:FBA_2 domain-containing protein n=1 Tax=Caenorhabditis tropicalis TaxID=1561998 RepID=A0A1I7T6T1_9PELO
MRLIKSVGWREIRRITYKEYPKMSVEDVDELSISIESENGLHLKIVSIFDKKWAAEYTEKTSEIIVSGMEIICSFLLGYYLQTPVFFWENNKDDVIKAIHFHIDELFGKNAEYKLESRSYLPTFTQFIETELGMEQNHDSSLINEYLSMMPVQKQVVVRYGSFLSLHPNHKFWNTQVLEIQFCFTRAPEVLQNFRGRIACLTYGICNSSDIIRFLKRWKHEKAFPTLETFALHIKWSSFEPEMIEEEIGIKNYPDTITLSNAKQSLPPEWSRYLFLRVFFDFEVPNYIVRDDGIIADLLIDETRMFFSVKKCTEKQMLENGFIS